MEKDLYLIKGRTILGAGIKSNSDESIIYDFDNLRVQTDNEDPAKIVIPSYQEVVKIALSTKDTSSNTKWTLSIDFGNFTINSDYFNEAYTTAYGIEVYDLQNNPVTLISASNPNIGEAQNPVQAENADAVLIIYNSTDYTHATFLQGDWIVGDFSQSINDNIIRIDSNISYLQNNKADKGDSYLKAEVYNKGEIDIKQNNDTVRMNAIETAANALSTRATAIETAATALTTRTTAIEAKNTAQDTFINSVIAQSNTDHFDLNTATTGLKDRVYALENVGNASLVTAYTTYSSDLGTPQNTGGTNSLAVFNLADLKNPNAGSATSADFTFTDESIFTIKARFKTDGSTLFHNIVFNINCGDAEPTFLQLGDRNGANLADAVIFRAQLAIGGTITFSMVKADGTPLNAETIINLPSMTINEVNQIRATVATNVVSVGDLAATNTRVSTLEGAITQKAEATAVTTLTQTVTNNKTTTDAAEAALQTAVNTKLATTDFNAYKTTNDAAVAGKANIDLRNVNVGTTHAGKSLVVKSDGTLDFANGGGKLKWTNVIIPLWINQNLDNVVSIAYATSVGGPLTILHSQETSGAFNKDGSFLFYNSIFVGADTYMSFYNYSLSPIRNTNGTWSNDIVVKKQEVNLIFTETGTGSVHTSNSQETIAEIWVLI